MTQYRSTLVLLAIYLLSAGAIVLGWRWHTPPESPEPGFILTDEPGLLLASRRAGSPLVENGMAFDKATLEIASNTALVVPDNAKIEHIDAKDRIEIFLQKIQSFGGFPPQQMSIRVTRKGMGCVKKLEVGKTIIATYGEWDSNIEGGTFIGGLVVRVPDSAKVESRKGLSGPTKARRGFGEPQTRLEGFEPGTNGWQVIPDEPDPAMTARSRQ